MRRLSLGLIIAILALAAADPVLPADWLAANAATGRTGDRDLGAGRDLQARDIEH